jgi:hypothetical protein
MRRGPWTIALACMLFATRAHAADDPEPSGLRAVWRDVTAGTDLLKTAPTIAVIDGSWSIGLQIGSFLTTRTWRQPLLRGVIAQESTRILYGTSWTAMLGLESLLMVVASGSRFDWLGEATYRTDWMFGLSLPSCPYTGAYGGCGIGIGGFGGLHLRPLGSRWWFEAGGGWVEQRVANDERRTLAESVWVLTPIAAAYEVKVGGDPLELRVQGGPGVYFGMHNAHVHPTKLGEKTLDPPWTEIYPLDTGGGVGGRVEARAIVMRRFSLDAELIMAPFFVGGATHDPPPDVAPLDAPRGGVPVWRYVALGASFDHTPIMPMRAGVSVFGAELSGRPVEQIGHRGVMIRFEFPLRLPARSLPLERAGKEPQP